MLITVLYSEVGGKGHDYCGEIPEWESATNSRNAFEFDHPDERKLTVKDLVEAFPLGPAYQIDVLQGGIGSDNFVPATDLAITLRPIDGVIVCRVFKLRCTPSYTCGKGEGGRLSRQERVGKCESSSNRPLPRRQSFPSNPQNAEDQEQRSFAGSRQGRSANSGNIGGDGGGGVGVKTAVKDLNINAGKAVKGLMNLMGNAVQWTAGHLSQELTVGNYKVQMVKEMAEGGFSKVYLVRDARTHQPFAMKQMLCQERETAEAARKEIEVLRTVRHRNVISLLDQVSLPSKSHPGAREFLLLFPFYERGTVWDAITAATGEGVPWPYPEPVALRTFLGACCGVNAMHSHGYVHRDMKPLNLLVGDGGSCVVMDVGSACPTRREVHTRQEALLLEDEASRVCSAAYRPPELTQVEPGAVIDERVDVWSLGCTLYAMAFGRSPFETPREGVLKLGILNGTFSFPRGCRHGGTEFSTAFCDFITWMLNVAPAERPRCPEVIERTQELITRRR